MIQFPCVGCGHVFTVSDDDAGRAIQCTDCGRLNDVPTHSDVENLDADGAFKIRGPFRKRFEPAQRAADVVETFRPTRVDDEGQEIDLRNTPEDLAGLDQPIALEPGQKPVQKPKYDPETGELIRPLELRSTEAEPIDPASIPLASPAPRKAVAISDAPRGDPAMTTPGLFNKLLETGNVAVMGFVLFGLFFGYLVLLLFISISEQTISYPVWPLNVMFWLAACHFGSTIVAIGPEDQDELPRPLQSLSPWDDLLAPLLKVVGAALICYLPMFAVLAIASGRARLIALPLMVAGGYVFPAVLLTLTTSGSLMDLHPDCLRAVMRVGGRRYRMLAIGWIIVFPLYLWATLRVNLIFSSLNIEEQPYWRGELLIAVPLMVVTVFYLHYFCWQLGLLFRAGHDRFGWEWEELFRQRDLERRARGSINAADRLTRRREREDRAASAANGQRRSQTGKSRSSR